MFATVLFLTVVVASGFATWLLFGQVPSHTRALSRAIDRLLSVCRSGIPSIFVVPAGAPGGT